MSQLGGYAFYFCLSRGERFGYQENWGKGALRWSIYLSISRSIYLSGVACFSDIASLVALYRPGPIQSGMLDLFAERKHGRKKTVYDHPDLEPILKDTYGTMVYQEQVMQIAKNLAYFSPGEADRFRKAMGKKKPEEISAYRAKFIEGAKMNDIPPKVADKIFAGMLQFAGYGFNKSHSIAYALIAYQTAWLKANYPKEFMTALLESEKAYDSKYGHYKHYRAEARRLGVRI